MRQKGGTRLEHKETETRPVAFSPALSLSVPEALLVQRCQRRDHAAFDEVVSRYKGRIFNYVFRMVGSSEEAEDITQEVFVRMYQSLDTFRSEASLSTWLFRIANNLCIDHFRRSRKLRAHAYSLDETLGGGDDGERPEIADTTQEPYRALAQGELSERMEQAISAIPEKLRAVLILHDVEDVPYEEIARIVACPLGTVKSRLFHARMNMRQKISAYLASEA